jgi:hypothetical protein
MKYFKVILVLFLFWACNDNSVNRPEKPDNLLSEKEMVNIIYDMSIISGAKGVNKKLIEREGIKPESYIYELHNIDSLQFLESNNYYAYDLKAYKRIYSAVRKKLEKDKVKYDTLAKKEKQKLDSINKLKRDQRKKIIIEDSEVKKNLSGKIDTSRISTRQ